MSDTSGGVRGGIEPRSNIVHVVKLESSAWDYCGQKLLPLEVKCKACEILQDRAPLHHSSLLWMDCICINQADDDDKSSQITVMSDICQQTTPIIMWLGLSITGCWTSFLLDG